MKGKLMAKRGASEQFALSEEEVKKLWDVCKDPVDRVLIGLLLFCGLRVSEALHLKADWIKDGEMHIPFTMPCKCWDCRKRGYWQPKTKSGSRVIPVPSHVLGYLLTYLGHNPDGLPFNRIAAWARVKKLGEAAKMPEIFPHSLRASYATMLAATDIGEAALCYLLGWSDIKMASHYIKLAQARKRAAQKIREIFG